MSQGYCSPYPLIAVKGTLLCCHLKGNYLFPLGGGGETIVLWKRRKNVVEEEHGKCNGGEERGGGGKKNHGRRGGSLVEAELTYAQTSLHRINEPEKPFLFLNSNACVQWIMNIARNGSLHNQFMVQ